MPTRREFAISAPGASQVIPLDYMRSDYQCSIIVDTISGSPVWTAEVTGDDVYAPGYDGSAGLWQVIVDLTGISGSGKGHLAYPACGMRLNMSGTGSVRLVVLEGGSEGGRR